MNCADCSADMAAEDYEKIPVLRIERDGRVLRFITLCHCCATKYPLRCVLSAAEVDSFVLTPALEQQTDTLKGLLTKGVRLPSVDPYIAVGTPSGRSYGWEFFDHHNDAMRYALMATTGPADVEPPILVRYWRAIKREFAIGWAEIKAEAKKLL